jgi:hypothetical protein
MYVLTTNGHGELVRPIREHTHGHTAGHRYAVVRTDSGAWVSGEVVRVWQDERHAMRDHYRPANRRAELTIPGRDAR